jgi:hypothetical protein
MLFKKPAHQRQFGFRHEPDHWPVYSMSVDPSKPEVALS